MKKVIGIILVLILFYVAIKAFVFMPALTNAIVGSNKSPFQVGTDYVSEINAIYPYNSKGKLVKNDVKYSTNTATSIIGKATLQKINGKLRLTVESADPKTELKMWVTNTPEITNETDYIDFGLLLKSVSLREYVIDMKGGDVSLNEFKYLLIVDSAMQVHATIVFK